MFDTNNSKKFCWINDKYIFSKEETLRKQFMPAVLVTSTWEQQEPWWYLVDFRWIQFWTLPDIWMFSAVIRKTSLLSMTGVQVSSKLGKYPQQTTHAPQLTSDAWTALTVLVLETHYTNIWKWYAYSPIMAEVCVGWGRQLRDDLFKGVQSLCVCMQEKEKERDREYDVLGAKECKKATIIPNSHSALLVVSLIHRRSLNMSGGQKPESYFTRQ